MSILEDIAAMKPMKIILLSFLSFLTVSVYCQNLTGYWKGTITTEGAGGKASVQQLEVNIIQKGDKLEGCSHDYTLGRQDYCRASLTGSYDKATDVVKTFGQFFLEKRAANGVDHVLFDTRLVYRKVNDKEMLVGRIVDGNEGISNFFFNVTERIVLNKVGPLPNPKDKCYFEHIDGKLPEEKAPVVIKKDSAVVKKNTVPKPSPTNNTTKTTVKPPVKTNKPVTNKIVVTKPPLKNTQAPKNTDTRKTEIVQLPKIDSSRKKPVLPEIHQTVNSSSIAKEFASRDKDVVRVINVKTPVIKVEVYDNGEIDGDTVSVIYNGKVVVSKQMLTAKPITLSFNLDDGTDKHEITMFAHNLGRIPPNTALMIVTAGDQRFELRTSQDFRKNAVVVFEYKPDSQ